MDILLRTIISMEEMPPDMDMGLQLKMPAGIFLLLGTSLRIVGTE